MYSQETAVILRKLVDSIEEKNHEKVLRFSETVLMNNTDEDIMRCKTIALIKLNKFEQASQVQKSMKTESEEHNFLKAYVSYKLQKYQDTISQLEKIKDGAMKNKILLAQAYNKIENFEKSVIIYLDLLSNYQDQLEDDYEDICANYLNSLSWSIWTKKSQGQEFHLGQAEKSALAEVHEYLAVNKDKITYREIWLNFCILLAVSTGMELGLTGTDLEVRRFMFQAFYDQLSEDNEGDMAEEFLGNDTLDDRGKDLVICKILEGLFGIGDKIIQYNEEELQNVEKNYEFLNNKSDLFLKISTLSFLVFMRTSNNEATTALHLLTKELDKVLEQVKKENISPKLKKVLMDNLTFNKIITLLYRNKFSDAVPLINTLNFDENCYVMKFFSALRTKNQKEIEKLTTDQSVLGKLSNGPVLANLLQLSAYSSMANNKKYIAHFKQFFHQYFLGELKKSPESRFVDEQCFGIFSRAIVQHIFKNNALLLELKDHISEITDYLDDQTMLHQIAESYAKKGEVAVAHNIYGKIMNKFSGDDKAQRKFLFYQAFKDPKAVNLADLPPLEMVTDHNTMRSIEMDYLQYKGVTSAQRPAENKNKLKVKKRIRKIRWPRGFDHYKLQAGPDTERWVPKMERAKFRKMADKKGLVSRTQGTTTNVNQTQSKNTFQKGPSTATQDTAQAKGKKKTGGMRRK